MPSFMNFKVTLKRNNLLISILGIKKREQKINMWSSYNTQTLKTCFISQEQKSNDFRITILVAVTTTGLQKRDITKVI